MGVHLSSLVPCSKHVCNTSDSGYGFARLPLSILATRLSSKEVSEGDRMAKCRLGKACTELGVGTRRTWSMLDHTSMVS